MAFEADANLGKPTRRDDGPQPDPAGRWLLIMYDRHDGGLYMRRYADEGAAKGIAINWLGGEGWVFEVGREIPREEMFDQIPGPLSVFGL
jgi:hypothetical protein